MGSLGHLDAGPAARRWLGAMPPAGGRLEGRDVIADPFHSFVPRVPRAVPQNLGIIAQVNVISEAAKTVCAPRFLNHMALESIAKFGDGAAEQMAPYSI